MYQNGYAIHLAIFAFWNFRKVNALCAELEEMKDKLSLRQKETQIFMRLRD